MDCILTIVHVLLQWIKIRHERWQNVRQLNTQLIMPNGLGIANRNS